MDKLDADKKISFRKQVRKKSLEGLKHDHEFLLRGEIFSRELIESWIEYKINKEIRPLGERPHPYEFALYCDV
jgi:glutamine synthetase